VHPVAAAGRPTAVPQAGGVPGAKQKTQQRVVSVLTAGVPIWQAGR